MMVEAYVDHPMIRPGMVERRMYQLGLAAIALERSTLAVLPTGLGKTVVALMVIAARLERGKALILSPTKPLVEQHARFFRDVLNVAPEEVVVFTGEVPPARRKDLWEGARVVVSTPQVVENDLLARRISLTDVSHITFDEAHRAVGNYAYVYIARQYQQQAEDPLVLGITASPGGREERIEEVCANLFIDHLEVRTEHDSDVAPYVHDKTFEWVKVEVPEELEWLKSELDSIYRDRAANLAKMGYIRTRDRMLTKKELLGLQRRLQGEVRSNPHPNGFQGLSVVAELLKLGHAIELAETQGPAALERYLRKLQAEANSRGGSKASRRLMDDLRMERVIDRLELGGDEHPKLEKVREIVSDQLRHKPDSRVIVFTNYRDTAEVVTRALEEVKGVSPVRFVGQGTRFEDKGLTQRQQAEIIDAFTKGDYNTLVATSIGEEGLDIPATDLVLFYEPVPSEIRSIQRRGRTGRKRAGRVVVLMARGTRDEAFYWISKNKERQMETKMRRLQREDGSRSLSNKKSPEQKGLFDFDEDDIRVYVDNRETRSPVVRALEERGTVLMMTSLEVGDYVVSDRVGIERKTAEDFVSSLIDHNRDLFRQVADLKSAYECPILIIEGDGLYTARRIHPNAIRGSLASIAVDFGIPILTTRDAEETAAIIGIVARREQEDQGRDVHPHGGKTRLTLPEQQEYLVSAIPGVGPVVTRNLLLHFGTVERIMTAEESELMSVELVGKKTAQKIREVAGTEYRP